MEERSLWQPMPPTPQEQKALAVSCRLAEACGLTLTPDALGRLAEARQQALRQTRRVEFGGSILPQLIAAFCDSPYLSPRSCADTLAELTGLFYQLKGVCREALEDEELLRAMRRLFDAAGGATEPPADADAAALAAAAARDPLPGPADAAWEEAWREEWEQEWE